MQWNACDTDEGIALRTGTVTLDCDREHKFMMSKWIKTMKKTVFIIFFLILSISCSKPQVNLEVPGEVDHMLMAQQIFSLVNTERQSRGLYKLKYDEKLAEVALMHSRNMVEQDLLSHEDRQKRSSQERVETYYPEMIFGEIGENIGYSQGYYGEAVAKNLIETWMNSPDLRANILSTVYSHMGAGVKREGSRYFGTIKFITAIVKVPDGTIQEVEFGSEATIRFEFVGNFDRHDLTIHCQFPDSNARYYTYDNQFYTGTAPLTPEWVDRKTFSVTFRFDKGKGPYTFKFGKEGNFYKRGYTVTAK